MAVCLPGGIMVPMCPSELQTSSDGPSVSARDALLSRSAVIRTFLYSLWLN